MKKTAFLQFSAMSLCVLSLSACSGVKEQLGVARHSPDEFTVVKRAPLSMPPTYNLRAPTEAGAEASTQMTQQAKETVFGTGQSQVSASAQSGEAALLNKVGANQADPNIRNVLNKENGYLNGSDKTLAEKVLFWQGEDQDGTLVDPKEEAKRLQENRDKNLPLNTGDVKVKE